MAALGVAALSPSIPQGLHALTVHAGVKVHKASARARTAKLSLVRRITYCAGGASLSKRLALGSTPILPDFLGDGKVGSQFQRPTFVDTCLR